MTAPIVVRHSNHGSSVEYPDGTTTHVDSSRIWAAKLAMFSHEDQVPESMRQELRDAIQARTDELMTLDTAPVIA